MSDPDDEGEVRLKLVDGSQLFMAVATTRMVSLKRLLVESPWLQFTSECRRF
jgi:hypothetical protein